jgi:hypothetical protein
MAFSAGAREFILAVLPLHFARQLAVSNDGEDGLVVWERAERLVASPQSALAVGFANAPGRVNLVFCS